MNEFRFGLWQMQLASGWMAESEEECVIIVKSEISGALQISAYQKEGGVIGRHNLLDATQLDAASREHLGEEQCGEFAGYHLHYSEGDVFWPKWWLVNGRTLLFVTYNCDLARKVAEAQDVDQMMQSLKAI